MRKIVALTALVVSIGNVHAEKKAPTFIEQLDGLAAACFIDGASAKNEAFVLMRERGESSKAYKDAVAVSFKAAKECVDTNKPKGKDAFKAEVQRIPDLKDKISDAYASWVGYMDWLSTPHQFGDESEERKAYEAARNRLQAGIDLL